MKSIAYLFLQLGEDKHRLMYYHVCCMLSLLVSLFRIVFIHFAMMLTFNVGILVIAVYVSTCNVCVCVYIWWLSVS